MNCNNQIHGVGRRIRVFANNSIQIWEGQFNNGELDGFGRWLACYWTGVGYKVLSYIGFWDSGQHQGYGRLHNDIEETLEEGIFLDTMYQGDIVPIYKPDQVPRAAFEPDDELMDHTLK